MTHTVWLREYEPITSEAINRRGRRVKVRANNAHGSCIAMEWCQKDSQIPFGTAELSTELGTFRLTGMAVYAGGNTESLYEKVSAK